MKREHEREPERGEHAQRRARGVFGQMSRIQGQGNCFEFRQRREQSAACFAEEGDQADHQYDRDQIPAASARSRRKPNGALRVVMDGARPYGRMANESTIRWRFSHAGAQALAPEDFLRRVNAT